MATSRPQLFEAQLLSTKMNPQAYCSLHEEQKIIETNDEKIGDYTFQSAYVPLRDGYNRTIGYINLPYFARESEFRADISTFLVAFINIYVILTVIAILVALIVSNYITLPLQIIKDKISQINYFKKPEKIKYTGVDELADLIIQYNQMVDDLAHSAEMLVSSERESAWRIMAQQVAHEIKNPLGGIRGAAQLLEHELNNPGLREYTQVIIKETDRLQDLMKRLLSPHRPMQPGPVNIHEILERVRSLLAAEFPHTLTMRRDYDTSLPDLVGDLLEQEVSLLVTKGVVDLLEPVQVQKAQAARRLPLLKVSHKLFEGTAIE